MTGSRIRRGQLPRLFLAFGLLLAAATMAVAFAATSVGGGRPQRLLEANAAMDSLLLRQAVVVEGRQPADLATFDRLSRDFDDALSRGGDATRAGSTDRALLTEQAMLADRWRSSAARSLLAPREQRARDVEERARLLDGFSARNAALAQRASSAQAARNRTRRLVLLFTAIGFVALLALAGAFTALRGWRRHAARVDEDKRLLLEDRRHRAAQEEFGRALQGTRTQREAQRMLKRYLERGLPSSLATVLDRDNADNRLEAVTGLRPDSPLASTLEREHAQPAAGRNARRDRCPHWPGQPSRGRGDAQAHGGQRRPHHVVLRGSAVRPRPLQARQRRERPRGGRSSARCGRRRRQGLDPRQRLRRALRRRGVPARALQHRRRGAMVVCDKLRNAIAGVRILREPSRATSRHEA